jgi:CheY-like chemotaxis protein
MVARLAAGVALAVLTGWVAGILLRRRHRQARPNAALPLGGTRLLLVEHDADSRDALSALLQMEGAIVTAVGDVKSAQARLATAPAAPQAVLLDVDLPDRGGESFLQRLRALEALRGWSRVPALALTGNTERGQRQRLQDAGFSAQLVKPHDISELLAQVKQACALPDRLQTTGTPAHKGGLQR